MDTTIATADERAAMLPEPEPSKVVTVPLELLPAYLQLHVVEPCGNDRGTLIVRRVECPD